MIKKHSYLPALLLAVASTLSYADPHGRGAYIEGNVGEIYASIHFLGVIASKFDSVGANVNAGYQFNNYLGAEAGFTQYAFSHGLNSFDLAGKFILPFQIANNDFNVFAKLGASSLGGHGGRAVAGLAGVGAGYAVTQNLDLNLQAQATTLGFFSLGLLSGGLTYHFN